MDNVPAIPEFIVTFFVALFGCKTQSVPEIAEFLNYAQVLQTLQDDSNPGLNAPLEHSAQAVAIINPKTEVEALTEELEEFREWQREHWIATTEHQQVIKQLHENMSLYQQETNAKINDLMDVIARLSAGKETLEEQVADIERRLSFLDEDFVLTDVESDHSSGETDFEEVGVDDAEEDSF